MEEGDAGGESGRGGAGEKAVGAGTTGDDNGGGMAGIAGGDDNGGGGAGDAGGDDNGGGGAGKVGEASVSIAVAPEEFKGELGGDVGVYVGISA